MRHTTNPRAVALDRLNRSDSWAFKQHVPRWRSLRWAINEQREHGGDPVAVEP